MVLSELARYGLLVGGGALLLLLELFFKKGFAGLTGGLLALVGAWKAFTWFGGWAAFGWSVLAVLVACGGMVLVMHSKDAGTPKA